MNYLIRNILYSTITFFTIFYGIGKLMVKEDRPSKYILCFILFLVTTAILIFISLIKILNTDSGKKSKYLLGFIFQIIVLFITYYFFINLSAQQVSSIFS